MRAAGNGGAIVNTSSVAATGGMAGLSAYAPSKAAIDSMTRVLALETGADAIRINSVSPRVIKTADNRISARGITFSLSGPRCLETPGRTGGHRRRRSLALDRRGKIHYGPEHPGRWRFQHRRHAPGSRLLNAREMTHQGSHGDKNSHPSSFAAFVTGVSTAITGDEV